VALATGLVAFLKNGCRAYGRQVSLVVPLLTMSPPERIDRSEDDERVRRNRDTTE